MPSESQAKNSITTTRGVKRYKALEAYARAANRDSNGRIIGAIDRGRVAADIGRAVRHGISVARFTYSIEAGRNLGLDSLTRNTQPFNLRSLITAIRHGKSFQSFKSYDEVNSRLSGNPWRTSLESSESRVLVYPGAGITPEDIGTVRESLERQYRRQFKVLASEIPTDLLTISQEPQCIGRMVSLIPNGGLNPEGYLVIPQEGNLFPAP